MLLKIGETTTENLRATFTIYTSIDLVNFREILKPFEDSGLAHTTQVTAQMPDPTFLEFGVRGKLSKYIILQALCCSVS